MTSKGNFRGLLNQGLGRICQLTCGSSSSVHSNSGNEVSKSLRPLHNTLWPPPVQACHEACHFVTGNATRQVTDAAGACSPVISNASSSASQVDGSAPVGKDFMTTPPCITTETISTTMVSGTRRLLPDPSPTLPQQPEHGSSFRKSSATLTVVRQITRFLLSATLAAVIYTVGLWFFQIE